MSRRVDPAAREQALRQWVLPECLHIAVAARDDAAITEHIGDIVEVLSPGRALLVAPDPPPSRDSRLPVWQQPNVDSLHDPLQVWVSPAYTRYRNAYRKAKGDAAILDKVVHHVKNRRLAALQGFGFVRVVPVSRSSNSSSGFSEQWGIALNTPNYRERFQRRGLRIQYADLADIMVMLDIRVGGGFMEAVRIGQDLVQVPGLRAPQS